MPNESSSNDEVVVCTGKVTKVEEVPTRNGVPAHTETLIDFSDDAKLLSPSNSYSSGAPLPLKHVVMMSELKYGKKYEVVLREVKPKILNAKNYRKILANNE